MIARVVVVALAIAASACGAADRSGPRPPALAAGADSREVVTLLVGPKLEHVLVRASPGLTIARVLELGLQLPAGGAPRTVELARGGHMYRVDVRAIDRGLRPDEPVGADDIVVVDGDYAARAQPAPAVPLPRPPPPPLDLATLTCGELLLRSAMLLHAGHAIGDPDVTAVVHEMERCGHDDHDDSFRTACLAAYRRHAELVAGGKGPKHPDVLEVEGELSVCPGLDLLAEPAPTP